MAAVAVLWKRPGRTHLPRPAAPAAKAAKKHPKAFLLTKNGVKFVFPYAPIPVDSDGYAGEWSENTRPGRKPLLQYAGQSLREMTFVAKLSRQGEPLHHMVESLKRIVASKDSVTFSYGSTETGIYQITRLQLRVVRREHGTNQPTEVDATFTLKEQSLASLILGPLSGGLPATSVITAATGGSVVATSAAGGTKPPAKASAPAGKVVVVKPSESPAEFAYRATGAAANWKAILDYNKITRSSQFTAGKRLTIPPGMTSNIGGSPDSQDRKNADARKASEQWFRSTADDPTYMLPSGKIIPI